MTELWLALRYSKEEKTKTISTCFHFCVENGRGLSLENVW